MVHQQPNHADSKATYGAMNDEALIERILSRDSVAEETLVRRYTPLLIQYLRARSTRHYEDVYQETFALALARLASLRRRDRFGPWLLTIARRSLASWARDDARHGGLRYWEQVVYAVREWSGGARQSFIPDPDLDDNAKTILAAIQAQPERYRMILYLSLIHEKSPQNIAKELNLKSGTVRMRLKRGLERLRKSLKINDLQ